MESTYNGGISTEKVYNDNIVLGNVGKLDLKEDITPLESARISQLLSLCIVANENFGVVNIEKFVDKYELNRHFEKLDEETDKTTEN